MLTNNCVFYATVRILGLIPQWAMGLPNSRLLLRKMDKTYLTETVHAMLEHEWEQFANALRYQEVMAECVFVLLRLTFLYIIRTMIRGES